jgi:disulfide bond formation protein DsbB
MTMNRRALNGLGLLVCLGLLGYAYYAQYHLHLEPCPLCIFQRIGVASIALAFLLATLHDPKGKGARVYGVLIAMTSAITVGVAARHVWIQHLPPDQIPSCGASLNYLMEIFPLTDVIRTVLTGSGECAKVTWTFLGLSMPTWVGIAATALGIYGVSVNITKIRRNEIRF